MIVKKQRDLNRVMTPVIQTRMVTGYNACNLEQGRGMFDRMKSQMSRHVDSVKSVMFRDASVTLLAQLSKLQVHVSQSNQSINHASGDTPYVSLKNESQARTPFVTRSRLKVCKSTF